MAESVMVGPWDEFKTQESGPWDEFQGQNESSVKTVAPKKEYTLGETAVGAVKNAIPSAITNVENLASGVYNLIRHPKKSIKDISQILVGAGLNILPDEVSQFVSDAPEAKEKATQVGHFFKDRYGGWSNVKRTVAEDPVGVLVDFASALSGVGEAAGLPKVAALGAKINPLTYAAKVPGAILKSAGTPANFVANKLLSPKTGAYLDAVEGRGSEVVSSLRNSPAYTPGSMPTAAQAAADTGVIGFQGLGKEAAKVLPTEYAQRELAQKQANIQAIEKVGGTPGDIQKFQDIRSATAAQLYPEATSKVVKVDKDLEGLFRRPSMQKALARAEELAAEKRSKVFVKGKSSAGSPLVDENGIFFSQSTQAPTEIFGSGLHHIKTSLDDMLTNPEQFGIGAQEAKAIGDTRKEFLNWTEKNLPEYKKARETFSEQSKPINQAQILQELGKKVTPIMGEETSKLRASGFVKAVDDAPKTVKSATKGAARYQNLSEILTPEQLNVVEGVRKDLERGALSDYLSSKSSKNVLNSNIKLDTPSMLSVPISVANFIYRKLAGKITEKAAMEIAQEMLTPELAAKAIDSALKRKASTDKIGSFLKKGTNVIENPLTGAYVNFTNTEERDRRSKLIGKR